MSINSKMSFETKEIASLPPQTYQLHHTAALSIRNTTDKKVFLIIKEWTDSKSNLRINHLHHQPLTHQNLSLNPEEKIKLNLSFQSLLHTPPNSLASMRSSPLRVLHFQTRSIDSIDSISDVIISLKDITNIELLEQSLPFHPTDKFISTKTDLPPTLFKPIPSEAF